MAAAGTNDVTFADAWLDNAAWHSLIGVHQSIAVVSSDGRARAYDAQFGTFAAIERCDRGGWDALGDLVGDRGVAVLFRVGLDEPPPPWKTLGRFPSAQMIARNVPAPPDDIAFTDLGLDDAADVVALAALAEPGPFASRTAELGDFIGLRDESGRLIAMAGQRFRAGGWVEISAVSTHPDARGHGLGAAITQAMTHRIAATGARAFLHVLDTNPAAHRLYTRLGFETRCTADAGAFRYMG